MSERGLSELCDLLFTASCHCCLFDFLYLCLKSGQLACVRVSFFGVCLNVLCFFYWSLFIWLSFDCLQSVLLSTKSNICKLPVFVLMLQTVSKCRSVFMSCVLFERCFIIELFGLMAASLI